MTAAKNLSVEPENLDSSGTAPESKKENRIQSDISNVVGEYADGISAVKRQTIRKVAKLSRDVAFEDVGAPVPGEITESPYEPLAANGKTELVLKDDPAKNPEILASLEKFNKKTALEKLPALSVGQRERIMGYYKLAKSQQGLNDRAVASGISGMVLGYVEIEDVRRFVEEYSKTGKLPKGLPLPYANFKGASEKFPGAETYLANELTSTKKLDERIGQLLDKEIAENRKTTDENRKQIEALDRILKLMK